MVTGICVAYYKYWRQVHSNVAIEFQGLHVILLLIAFSLYGACLIIIAIGTYFYLK